MVKIAISASVSAILGAAAFAVLQHVIFPQRSVGAVRVEDVIGAHVQAYGAQNMGPKEIEEATTRYAAAFKGAIERIAQQDRVTLLVSQAVVSAIPDYTERVKKEMVQAADDAGKRNRDSP